MPGKEDVTLENQSVGNGEELDDKLNEEIAMPGEQLEIPELQSVNELMTGGIEESLVGDEVKAVLIAETSEIVSPSYLIDMTGIQSVAEEAIKAISCLTSGGDTAVYIKSNTNIALIGYGEGRQLYTILSGLVKHMLGEGCDLYTNRGSGFEPVAENEIKAVRLNL